MGDVTFYDVRCFRCVTHNMLSLTSHVSINCSSSSRIHTIKLASRYVQVDKNKTIVLRTLSGKESYTLMTNDVT